MSKTEQKRGNNPKKVEFVKVAECLYRNASSQIYYALVKRRGKQFRKSLKTTDRALAQRRLVEYRDKVSNLSPSSQSTKLSFSELADRWLEIIRGSMKESSALRREVSIKQLKPFFGNMLVRNVVAADCDNWVIKRGNSISASSFNNERDTLIQIFELAKRDGLILDNPAKNISRRKMGKPQIVIPTQEQFKVLVQSIRDSNSRAQTGADLVELLAYSGMRLTEATSMKWGDIHWDRNTFTVTGGETGTKNHEARTVPLFPALRQFLEKLKGDSSPAPSQTIVGIASAKTTIHNACKTAQLPAFHHHSLRHYFVSNAIEQNIDFKTIAGWVGHKDGGVLVARTYGHLRDTHSFDMAKRMTFSATNATAENVITLQSVTG